MATQDFSLQQLQPFLEGNPERGVLRVQVSTALGAFPVNRALVEVAVMLGGGRVPCTAGAPTAAVSPTASSFQQSPFTSPRAPAPLPRAWPITWCL